LTVIDGNRQPRRYWNVAPNLFPAEVVAVPRRPCPFAGSAYQLMRNLAFAHEWALKHELPYYGFVVSIVDAPPAAAVLRRQVAAFRPLLLPDAFARVGVISYEQIADVLDAYSAEALAEWLRDRIAAVVSSG
jgi:hypothetical protein